MCTSEELQAKTAGRGMEANPIRSHLHGEDRPDETVQVSLRTLATMEVPFSCRFTGACLAVKRSKPPARAKNTAYGLGYHAAVCCKDGSVTAHPGHPSLGDMSMGNIQTSAFLPRHERGQGKGMHPLFLQRSL